MTRHPCPVCGEVVPVGEALDYGCPECRTPPHKLRRAARGDPL
jgi:predicted  nucleic acid-binding Zn-ribbon protein